MLVSLQIADPGALFAAAKLAHDNGEEEKARMFAVQGRLTRKMEL